MRLSCLVGGVLCNAVGGLEFETPLLQNYHIFKLIFLNNVNWEIIMKQNFVD
jgi:hypothetical protein